VSQWGGWFHSFGGFCGCSGRYHRVVALLACAFELKRWPGIAYTHPALRCRLEIRVELCPVRNDVFCKQRCNRSRLPSPIWPHPVPEEVSKIGTGGSMQCADVGYGGFLGSFVSSKRPRKRLREPWREGGISPASLRPAVSPRLQLLKEEHYRR